MIKILTPKDKKKIIDFCMKNERENLFVLGSFLLYKNGFKLNRYIGYFEEFCPAMRGKTAHNMGRSGLFEKNRLTGLAVYFPMYKSFVINASPVATNKLVDFNVFCIRKTTHNMGRSGLAVKQNFYIKAIPVFKKYALPMIKRLKHHGLTPVKISRETVFILEKKFFINFSKGGESISKNSDIKELVLIDRILNHKDPSAKISKEDKDKIDPKTTFILKRHGKIISKVNLHGMSKNYFQIGGVITLPAHRGKGYAKMVLSKLCEHYFNKGFKYGMLFTADTNVAARKVYKKLGFKPVDKFIIAEY